MKKIIPVLFACILIVAACGESLDGKTGSGEAADGKSGKITVTPASACVEKNTQQQFESSVGGVEWSLEIVLSDTPAIGTVTQDGLFTAGNEPALGKVVASKGGEKGFAYVTIVPSKALCSVTKVKLEEKKGEGENKETSEKTNDETTTPPSPTEEKPFGEGSMTSKWLASFDASLTYEVIGDDIAGYVTHKMDGGFYFTVDYATGQLKVIEPIGFVNVTVSDDVASCESSVINDPFLWITATDGKLKDTEIVFGQKYLTVDHAEGVKMTCLRAKGISYPDASMVDLIGKYAFPVSVDLKEDASAPIHAFFSFMGRDATIDGTVTLRKVDTQTE